MMDESPQEEGQGDACIHFPPRSGLREVAPDLRRWHAEACGL